MGLITAAKLLLKGKKLLGSESVDVWKSKAAKAKLDSARFNFLNDFNRLRPHYLALPPFL